MTMFSSVTNCYCQGKCFARYNGKCSILNEGYIRDCPFQKENALYTDGKFYPYVDYSLKNYTKKL